MIKQNNLAGFSLVETAVVLLVTALIAAGVLAGAELMRKAQLNTIVEETEVIKKGIDSFINTYKALPGDMPDATDKLGATLGAYVIQNGNGDGSLLGAERIALFQHLAAAGFISGIYDGVTAQPGVGLMASATDPNLAYAIESSSASNVFIRLTRYQNGSTVGYAALTPQEAWSIDQKYDDGASNTGLIIGSIGLGNIGNCISASNYDLSNDDKACILVFRSLYAPTTVTQAVVAATGCADASGDYVAAGTVRLDENCDNYLPAVDQDITETCVSGGSGKYYWEVNSGQTCGP